MTRRDLGADGVAPRRCGGASRPSLGALWDSHSPTVPDPEIPVVSVVELGILRGIEWDPADPPRSSSPSRRPIPAALPPSSSWRRSATRLFAAGVRGSGSKRASSRRGRPTGSRRTPNASSATTASRRRMATRACPTTLQRSTSPASVRCAARRRVACPRCGSKADATPVPVRLDRVQGALPLPRLPRAVRLFQAALAIGAAPTMSKFHRLPVAKVERETRDAVAITFAVPDALAEPFRFAAGQHLTLRTDIGGAGRAPLVFDLFRRAGRNAAHRGEAQSGRRVLGAGRTSRSRPATCST